VSCPARLIGDRAYDTDGLDWALAQWGVEMIAPHRRGRARPKTPDGRSLRRYRRRWKIERLWAWRGVMTGAWSCGTHATRSLPSALSLSAAPSFCSDGVR
jgi:hypothetical protein